MCAQHLAGVNAGKVNVALTSLHETSHAQCFWAAAGQNKVQPAYLPIIGLALILWRPIGRSYRNPDLGVTWSNSPSAYCPGQSQSQ